MAGRGRGRADVGCGHFDQLILEVVVEARSPGRPLRRLSTETKQAFKSTEFWVFVVVFIGILLAGTVDDSEGTQFGADDVWLYITLLTIGYMVSRGLAKSGSREPYTADDRS
jgi:hypothetical protein